MKKYKYQQIFNYLLEFSKIRSKPVRDIEYQDTHYPEKLWLADIPEDNLFENIIRESFNPENDYWIKVRKPKEPKKPSFPALSKTLENWIEQDSLFDDSQEPILKESIELLDKKLLIDDYPNIENEFNEYINTKWIDDLITYKTEYSIYEKDYELFEIQNNVYKSFFRIYNKAQQFGEEYELVIGVGLLNFYENAESPKIFRHAFTQRVEISFGHTQRDSQIIVKPTIESMPQLETDSIIDLVENFDSKNIIDAKLEVEQYILAKGISHLFHENLIKDVLQIYADRISPDGKFIDQLEKPKLTENKPVLYYSPALLLRKRNTRSFTALYENILKNIEQGPEGLEIQTLDDLIQIEDQKKIIETEFAPENVFSKINTIYFPKEHNEEQREIIEKLMNHNKVLVQGPPGTGKSHTIANIICHLLANGKKVLVTAYTKRALEVIKGKSDDPKDCGKLPKEFKNLTVSLLSGDSSSINDLESSVRAINEEISHANLNEYQKEIDGFHEQLANIRERIALTTNELIKIKEKSVRKQEISSDYIGTLTEIAERLEKESEEFSWYQDSFYDSEDNQIVQDLKQFLELHNFYKKLDQSEFKYWIPDKENLPSIKDIAS